jgi:uncharacterized protein (TIGR03435 family)
MKTKTIPAATAAVSVALTCLVSGQAADPDGPAFEVAVVRENRSGEMRGRIELINARFSAINMTLRELLSITYPSEGGGFRHASQLVGGPSWFETARFDIIAKVEGFQGDTNRPGFTTTAADREALDRVRRMMQGLLAERFKLKVHLETRELPIYELVIVDNKGELGPELRRSTTDCMAEWKKQGMPDARNSACGSVQHAGPNKVVGRAVSIRILARDLYDWSGRPVVDRTGITGNIDYTLTWSPDGSADSTAPSIFTALQEQLGLKLQPVRGPVEVLVVDSAEKPAAE